MDNLEDRRQKDRRKAHRRVIEKSAEDERRKKAEYYWHMAENRYRDSLCEYNSHPSAMSKLGLAAGVDRKKDPAMARRLLKEISEEHKGETDHLGKPLEESVQRILKTIR